MVLKFSSYRNHLGACLIQIPGLIPGDPPLPGDPDVDCGLGTTLGEALRLRNWAEGAGKTMKEADVNLVTRRKT